MQVGEREYGTNGNKRNRRKKKQKNFRLFRLFPFVPYSLSHQSLTMIKCGATPFFRLPFFCLPFFCLPFFCLPFFCPGFFSSLVASFFTAQAHGTRGSGSFPS